jgi:hypothetical protein
MRAITDHLEDYEWADTGEIVTGPTGRPARRASVSEAWKVAKKAAGLDQEMVPHDLRHYAATLMARMPGITTKELMARALIAPRCTDVSARNRGARPGNSHFMSEQLAAATRFQANSVVPIALYARHRISGAANCSEPN